MEAKLRRIAQSRKLMSTENFDDSIQLEKYNPEWSKLAAKEIEIIREVIYEQNWIIDIQHVGSTAVPGLTAKPIIDIYIGARSIEEAQQSIKPFEKLGYQFWKDNPNKEKMFFVKGMPPYGKGRTHHIHIIKYGSDYWNARILFRDYLRTHSDEAMRYAQLKHKLMEEFPHDREAYTDAKIEYIAFVLKMAGFNEQVKR